MAVDLSTRIGTVTLKNPLIAAPAEHLIEAAGIRAALGAGAAAVVVKSVNEVPAARTQLDRAEYLVFDEHWRPVPWTPGAPAAATIACRSGLTPQPFDAWLTQCATLDREAAALDSYVVASVVLGDLARAVAMAQAIEAAGVRVFELNIGTPYGGQSGGAVATELRPERVGEIVTAVRQAVALPLWVKVTGQSERVPDLAAAAFAAGADSVVMAGRLLGLVPDVDTLAPFLGTSLGIGGYWHLPLTCHWLATTRAQVGADRVLIGVNGATNGLDIARMMLAGASAVGLASPVMLRGFELIGDALDELRRYLQTKGLTAAGLVGRAADQRRTFADMPARAGRWRDYVPGDALDQGVPGTGGGNRR